MTEMTKIINIQDRITKIWERLVEGTIIKIEVRTEIKELNEELNSIPEESVNGYLMYELSQSIIRLYEPLNCFTG